MSTHTVRKVDIRNVHPGQHVWVEDENLPPSGFKAVLAITQRPEHELAEVKFDGWTIEWPYEADTLVLSKPDVPPMRVHRTGDSNYVRGVRFDVQVGDRIVASTCDAGEAYFALDVLRAVLDH